MPTAVVISIVLIAARRGPSPAYAATWTGARRR